LFGSRPALVSAPAPAAAKKAGSGLFGDDEDDGGLFGKPKSVAPAPAAAATAAPALTKKLSSLFDDDDDSGGSLFGSAKPTAPAPVSQPVKTAASSLFGGDDAGGALFSEPKPAVVAVSKASIFNEDANSSMSTPVNVEDSKAISIATTLEPAPATVPAKSPMLGGIKLPVPRRAQKPDSDDENEDDDEWNDKGENGSKQAAPVIQQPPPPANEPAVPPPIPPPIPSLSALPVDEPESESTTSASAKVSSGLAARMAGLGGMPMMMPGMSHPSMKKTVEEPVEERESVVSLSGDDHGNYI
jgi:hypothetical protein